MIRIAVISQNYQEIINSFSQVFIQENIQYTMDKYHQRSYYDIYIIEIKRKEDLQIMNILKKNTETLIYVIGPKDFEIANECIQYQVHLYFVKNNLQQDIYQYQQKIIKHIQERFQYYYFQKRGLTSQIRLSQIYYVESLRHQIIIHSLEGEIIERKNLSDFLKNIVSKQFIQIHRSYIVNRQYIKKINQQDIVLKNNTLLPIGRTYKKFIGNLNSGIME